MGNVFRRRRQPTEELDEIVKRLRELETQLKGHVDGRADTLRSLLIGAVGLWGAISAYAWLHFRALVYRVSALAVALFLSTLVFFALRYATLAAYNFLIERKRNKIQYYIQRRVRIIEDVKENETFKIVKEIIEKYGSEGDLAKLFNRDAPTAAVVNSAKNEDPQLKSAQDDMTSLALSIPAGAMTAAAAKSARRASAANALTLPISTVGVTATPLRGFSASTSALAPLSGTKTSGLTSLPRLHEMTSTRRFARAPVRPFVEPSTNLIDRILDYVMGESINNRYALICVICHTHNGMALREEFAQVTYFCFKCGSYNPSRKEMHVAAERIVTAQKQQQRQHQQELKTYTGPSRTPSVRSLAAIASDEEYGYEDTTQRTTSTPESTTSSQEDNRHSEDNNDDEKTCMTATANYH